MSNRYRQRTVKAKNIRLCPRIDGNVRKTLTGIRFLTGQLDNIPQEWIMDYSDRHPMVGEMSGTKFHVTGNFRTQSLVSLIPPETRISVLVDQRVLQDKILIHRIAERELLSLALHALGTRDYAATVSALYRMMDKSAVPDTFQKITQLAKFLGINRRSIVSQPSENTQFRSHFREDA